MRWEHLRQVLNPELTLRDMERAIRNVTRDPLDAERRVGLLYGHVFKNKETRYDAAGGRWLGAPQWS